MAIRSELLHSNSWPHLSSSPLKGRDKLIRVFDGVRFGSFEQKSSTKSILDLAKSVFGNRKTSNDHSYTVRDPPDSLSFWTSINARATVKPRVKRVNAWCANPPHRL